MALISFVLKRPYTVIALVILVCVLGVGALLRMATDIFPEINIPVVAVVWTYNGMSADEIQNRIVALHERQLASLVDDIQRIEANSYDGVGVIKVYLNEGADVSRAVSQLGSSALVVLKYMPRNITPPLILRYGATDVPIIQLSVTSDSLTDTRLNDLGQNVIRPDLAVVQGASVPYPYGGKPRVIMVDLDQQALQARGLSPSDVSEALQRENVILPSGDIKLGRKDYPVSMNNSPDLIASLNRFPIKQVQDKTIYIRDVAHVHDGFQVQTNSVSQNGRPAGLMMIRKTGDSSTLAVVNGVKKTLPSIRRSMPAGVSIKPIFDQSIFVKAALNSVVMGGTMAAGLTALMILLFLGNWKLTLIILVTIPLSIIAAILVMYCAGQTLNTMTLGGFALAVGILVDNGTVVIENIERHLGKGEELESSIVNGGAEIGVPTLLSTLSICIVFVPVFLLQGTAKYLFSPLSMSVCIALLASLILSFTLVPVLFKYLLRSNLKARGNRGGAHEMGRRRAKNPFLRIHFAFDRAFNAFRDFYRNAVSWSLARAWITGGFFVLFIGFSFLLFPGLGMDFFPQVDAGQMRLHVRAPPGTRIEQTQDYFAQVEADVRKLIGNDQIDVILDNIGLPYSGINIALSDSATIGPMDGEILIALKKKHTPTAAHAATLRRELPKRFSDLRFFFQPADIVNQVLNFGQPAPIDIRVTGADSEADFELASKLVKDLNRIPGVVDAHVFQVPDVPSLKIAVDRDMAEQVGLSQRNAAESVLVALNSSAQVSPNFWLDLRNNVSYPLVVQTPTYRIHSMQDLKTLPLATGKISQGELLMNLASFTRGKIPMVASQLNIRAVFDVNADVQGRDLKSAADEINKVIAADRPDKIKAITVKLSGQVQTMRESFSGLFSGMGLAVVLVYLLMVINFQSWLDPLIVLMAVPAALAGVIWMLFLTQTHISVPALMGTLMCIGLATANSILVVTFANQRMEAGDNPLTAAVAAGFTRLRPVLMTAGAMVLGMIPMALGVGEGGEQNAPLARAVIGGILFATLATLIFVPAMYRLLRRPGKPTAIKG
ncbi:MAG TPA: efflux RND transporter permease subunit [Tepidisphaeraceae bacterium]|jgi:multidrug efflux pump subunit AcrB|nr:efflux RND transporter permease subunit [Tepidisphaeraceae bacterium]